MSRGNTADEGYLFRVVDGGRKAGGWEREGDICLFLRSPILSRSLSTLYYYVLLPILHDERQYAERPGDETTNVR